MKNTIEKQSLYATLAAGAKKGISEMWGDATFSRLRCPQPSLVREERGRTILGNPNGYDADKRPDSNRGEWYKSGSNAEQSYAGLQ